MGIKMGVSVDSPCTDMAYKLVQFDRRPVMKLSSGKKTLAGPKQVFRKEKNGRLIGVVKVEMGYNDHFHGGRSRLES
jgi:nicotinic acid phosphoribosyltransferase